MLEEDKRIHARIQVTAEVRASGPSGVTEGTLKDLSKGGAGIYLPQLIGQVGDTIEVFLPFAGGLEIAVMAEILRITESAQGLLHGLRFNLVEPAMEEKLMELIEGLLKSRGSSTRAHPRISKRFPIRYGKLSELKAILENISIGGLSMVVPSPLVLYEEIEISIPDLSGKELLILNGRVLSQYPVEKPGQPKFYRVGIQFKELTEVARACLNELIKVVIKN